MKNPLGKCEQDEHQDGQEKITVIVLINKYNISEISN